MPVIDVTTSLVKIGAAQAGPFATIADLRTYSWDHSREDESRTRVFGSSAAYIKVGGKDHSYSLAGLYNPSDTGGQNVLQTAYTNGTDVWLQVLPNGTAGWAEKCKVRRYSGDGDVDGDFVGVAFELIGEGVTTAVPAV